MFSIIHLLSFDSCKIISLGDPNPQVILRVAQGPAPLAFCLDVLFRVVTTLKTECVARVIVDTCEEKRWICNDCN